MISWIPILAASLASIGFAIVFKIHSKHFFSIAIGGGLSWLSYLIFYHFTSNDTISIFFASFTITVFSEIIARINKAPSSIFYIPSMIPLIPGGNLYYFFSYYLQQDFKNCSFYGSLLLRQSLAIVLGTITVYTIFTLIQKNGYYHFENKKRAGHHD